MKTKSLLSKIALVAFGMFVMFAVEVNGKHHPAGHHTGTRKAAIIEVGAPLTVDQLKMEGLL
ncbi:MAG: hypothetical protein LWW85_08320 [Marinilabiliales bacterium]|nr:hypothetical protein [Marinilabiliales bacterium]